MDSVESLQTMLVAIPSQASSIAVVCVEHFIEDQINDPDRIAKNLKRLGSAILRRGDFAAGDAGFDHCNKGSTMGTNIPLLNLPERVRHQIWSYLEKRDIVRLRNVCSEIQFEIDKYGLPIILDTSSESAQFMQRVNARSCYVTQLDSLIYFNFMQQPELLQHIRFKEDVIIRAHGLDLILRKFPALRTISFSTKGNFYQLQGNELIMITPTNSKLILDVLSSKKNVFGVKVQYSPVIQTIEWKLELSPAPQECQVGYLHLSLPYTEKYLQEEVWEFLESQQKLYEIRSAVIGIPATKYTEVIQKNSSTLTALHLLNVRCSSTDAFDCKVLKECTKLRFFYLSGESSFSNSAFPFLPVIGIEHLASVSNLCAMSLEQVYMTEKEFHDLKENLNKTVFVRILQSKVEKEVVEMELGIMCSRMEKQWDNFYDRHFNQSAKGEQRNVADCRIVKSLNSQRLTDFIKDRTQRFPSELITGLILTTWIAFC